MIKLNFYVLFGIFILFLSAGSAFALSDDEYRSMLNYPEYAKAEKVLTNAWNKAKKLYPEVIFIF